MIKKQKKVMVAFILCGMMLGNSMTGFTAVTISPNGSSSYLKHDIKKSSTGGTAIGTLYLNAHGATSSISYNKLDAEFVRAGLSFRTYKNGKTGSVTNRIYRESERQYSVNVVNGVPSYTTSYAKSFGSKYVYSLVGWGKVCFPNADTITTEVKFTSTAWQ